MKYAAVALILCLGGTVALAQTPRPSGGPAQQRLCFVSLSTGINSSNAATYDESVIKPIIDQRGCREGDVLQMVSLSGLIVSMYSRFCKLDQQIVINDRGATATVVCSYLGYMRERLG